MEEIREKYSDKLLDDKLIAKETEAKTDKRYMILIKNISVM